MIGLQHCPPYMVIQGVQVGCIWRPQVFGNENWAVGLEPVLCGTSCVCWRAVLLEDASTGQQSSAVVDKTGKKTANIVRRILFSSGQQSGVVPCHKTHAIRDHHMLRKLLTLSEKTGWLDISFLAPAQTLLFWLPYYCLQTLRHR